MIGDKMRIAREKSGYTRAELAAGIMTEQTLINYENCRTMPTVDKMFALADKLGITVEQYCGIDYLPNRMFNQQERGRYMNGISYEQYKEKLPLTDAAARRYKEIKCFLASGAEAAEMPVFKNAKEDRTSYISQASKIWRMEGNAAAKRLVFKERRGKVYVSYKELR